MCRKSSLLLFFGLLFCFKSAISQSYYFGIKGGPSVGYQKWESFNQSPLITYHVSAFWESYSEQSPTNALYAQIGYHNRGSALRGAGFVYQNEYFRMPTRNFVFSNLSLAVGAKKKQELSSAFRSFYSFGLRGEYTVKDNLDRYSQLNAFTGTLYFPEPVFINKFTYGAQVGAGIEFLFSELIEGVFELTINPDLSNQYDQPELGSVYNPFEPANPRVISRRRIKNTTVELTFGIRFMRKVIYVD